MEEKKELEIDIKFMNVSTALKGRNLTTKYFLPWVLLLKNNNYDLFGVRNYYENSQRKKNQGKKENYLVFITKLTSLYYLHFFFNSQFKVFR